MFQFLAPLLAMLGVGGAGAGATGLAAGSALTAPALMGAGAGTAGGLASTLAPAIGPTVGAAAALPAAANPGIFASMFPGITQFGKSAMKRDLSGMGGGIGKMMGNENLANMLSNPSWKNLGALGKDTLNPESPLSPFSQEKQKPMAMPEQQARRQVPQTDDPILQQMYKNFNPQQTQSGMKSWGQSPYPKKMSAI